MIAYCKLNGYPLISDEKKFVSNKIPEVAKKNGVKCISLYKFVAIERRLEAHQHAIKHWSELISIIHQKNSELRSKVINGATNFWYENCLYLEKETRENFYKVIFLVSNYEIYLEAWKFAAQGPEKEKAHKDLIKTWDEIHALSSIIMREVELEPISVKEEKDAVGENIK